MNWLLITAALACHPGDRLVDLRDKIPRGLNSIDLVITVDTAVAHLAGAMGKPVWVLLNAVPDWRYHVDRPDNPWYPSMRLYRQTEEGRWPEVVERVALDLSALGR